MIYGFSNIQETTKKIKDIEESLLRDPEVLEGFALMSPRIFDLLNVFKFVQPHRKDWSVNVVGNHVLTRLEHGCVF